MQDNYYLSILYPLQDQILEVIERLNLAFYLTGGTALGRCYLNHRYSDDLDLFLNGHTGFREQSRIAVAALKEKWRCDVATTSDHFIRIFVQDDHNPLKIDFVNDVPFHFGEIQRSAIFHRVDNWRNILSNKLCALSRLEAKDLADIVFISRVYAFDWETILFEAKEKDLWIDPIEISRAIRQFSTDELRTIKWIGSVDIEEIKEQVLIVEKDIFSGSINSLAGKGQVKQ